MRLTQQHGTGHAWIIRKYIIDSNAESFLLTNTLTRPLKYLLPREKGFWQDIDNYYSEPPMLLQLPALSGTEDDLLVQMKQFATIAVQSG